MVDGRIETAEEKRRQHGAVEFVAALYRRFQPIDEKSPLAVQPAFLLDEVEKQKARKNQQRLSGGGFDGFAWKLRPERAVDFANRGAKSFEKLTGERLAIEGAIEELCVIGFIIRGEEIEAIEGVRRRISQIDVETP